MNGSEYFARALDAYGVGAVFYVPTIGSRSLYQLEEHTSIKRILTHGEKSAVYMADGYARATGRPGVAMAQMVGATNLAAGLRDPYLGCSPVVAITGGPFVSSEGRNFYQEVDNLPSFGAVTKWSTRVPNASRLPDLLEQAFRVSVSGKPGPAHLEFAGHLGDEIDQGEIAEFPDFHGVFELPATRPSAEPSLVTEALRRLLAAQRPVLVAGGGVLASGAAAEFVDLAERARVPVATSLNGKSVLPGNHPLNVGVPGLYSRPSANQLLLEADLVFFVGSQTGSQLTMSWQIPPLGTPVIQIDIDPAELGRHYPGALGLHGDAKVVLGQLLAALEGAAIPPRTEWTARAQTLSDRWHESVAAHGIPEDLPIRPERLCREFSEALPDDALVVVDTGHSGMWGGGYFDLADGVGFLRAAGSLGWGLPASIGAQIGSPDRQVVTFTGDGGFWYHVGELETAARWNVPLVVVVNDNHALNQEIGVYSSAYGGELHGRHGDLWTFRDTDLSKVAESMGVTGIRVDKPGEIAGALERAFEIDGPVVIDVATDTEVTAPTAVFQRAEP